MLELYKKESCPFCRRVMTRIAEQGRDDIVFHDIVEDESNRTRLKEIGGKAQVPCLIIDGEPLYESDAIVEWLNAHPQQ